MITTLFQMKICIAVVCCIGKGYFAFGVPQLFDGIGHVLPRQPIIGCGDLDLSGGEFFHSVLQSGYGCRGIIFWFPGRPAAGKSAGSIIFFSILHPACRVSGYCRHTAGKSIPEHRPLPPWCWWTQSWWGLNPRQIASFMMLSAVISKMGCCSSSALGISVHSKYENNVLLVMQ